ncbi:hypothetical protein [Nocardia salmonicida]|uniref:hypothetical protein n=1 Tax=Nocardia salmonicida TaxID=53431 RepID=UPI00362BD900
MRHREDIEHGAYFPQARWVDHVGDQGKVQDSWSAGSLNLLTGLGNLIGTGSVAQ